ncbi:MAG: hypothetical protein HC803_10920 [Saprospiraceae bacterium]|nr:hypothetical protein [Saprospiraceae bacterium]
MAQDDDPIMHALYGVLGILNMPIFIFMSGYFSKKITGVRKKDINELLYIYILFEVVNLVYTKVTLLGRGDFDILRQPSKIGT